MHRPPQSCDAAPNPFTPSGKPKLWRLQEQPSKRYTMFLQCRQEYA